ncbi:MAG: PEGA domain-containing protein [Kiritimatiellales bacterium]|nr:PEGA domain-containing protein [Kiritimatiellales bacterium]MCF7863528.1 PEGA domain-containing protein [Kiritimatiellales bacterium]
MRSAIKKAPCKNPVRPLLNGLLLLVLLWSACDVAAKNSKGSMAIASVPEGAQVLLNGTPQGQTPARISGLAPGTYVVELRKEGYERGYREVGLLEGQDVDVELQLEQSMGLLLVDSNPRGSAVVVKGEIRGTTPALLTDLPLGEYQIEIRQAGLPPRLVTVNLPDRKPVRVDVRHAPKVAVNSAPPGAEIRVDGEVRGTTPIDIGDLFEDMHEFTAVLDGYESQTRKVLLTPGLNHAIEFSLVKNSGILVLETEPALVHIFVDGSQFATTQSKDGSDSISQPVRIPLKAGFDHNIQLVRDGFVSETIKVRADIDQVIVRHEVLKRIFVYDTKITTDAEVILCRIEYRLPNGDIYYERYPGVFNTAKVRDIRDVQPISLDDESNREARRMIEQSKLVVPQ